MNEVGTIEYCGIRIAESAIAELDGRKVVVTVPRHDIQSAKLHWGWQAQHPLASLFFGGVLIAIGLLPLLMIVQWFQHGGTLPLILVGMIPMALIGGWLMLDALRRGFFVVINGPEGRQKLCFGRNAERAEVEAFLSEAEQMFGYRFYGASGAEAEPAP